jgi:outer membrane lipoprotein-sorting protein
MISGRRLSLAGALLALWAVGLTAQAAVPADFTGLMGLLAARHSARASFQARTSVPGLTRPLVSAGVLTYRAPDHLEQHTLTPAPSELILDGERLTMRRGSQVRRLDVRAYPQIAVYVTALRETLSGNARGLERHFDIEFTGTLAQWRLTLTPKAPRAPVSRIVLRGSRADIRALEIRMRSGARTVMQIGPPPS